MSTFFRDYKQAYNFAVREARRLGRIMQLRAGKEYGHPGYLISIAVQKPEKRFGSDARGEFISPESPMANPQRKRRKNPTRREGYVFGTHHFVSREAAIRYFHEYGEDASDVDRKIREGIIAIGPPKQKRYEKISIIPGEGRYQIARMRSVRVPSARRSAASAEALKRIRRENPSRYQGRNVYKMTAQKPGGKVLTLVQGNKFAERGKPVLFAEHGSAWATAQWLQDEFPALRRYTILVTNK